MTVRSHTRIAGLFVVLAASMVATASTARAGQGQDFTASVASGACTSQPPSVNAVSASQLLNGTRDWGFGLTSSVGATSANVSVDSGYGRQRLLVPAGTGICSGGSPPSSLPVSYPGFTCCDNLDSRIATQQAPGFDSSTSAQPLRIPRQGTQQTDVATFRLTDPTLDQLLKLEIYAPVPGATVVSASYTGPTGFDMPSGLANPVAFTGNSPALGQLYTFTVTFNIPNPYGEPFAGKPSFGYLVSGSGTSTVDAGPSSSEVIAVPSLDGATPGRGAATYTVTGAAGSWDLDSFPSFYLQYRPSRLPGSRDDGSPE